MTVRLHLTDDPDEATRPEPIGWLPDGTPIYVRRTDDDV